MQPDFDKLKKDFKDTPNVLIADADCAGSAQNQCGQLGIQGYPSMMSGRVANQATSTALETTLG